MSFALWTGVRRVLFRSIVAAALVGVGLLQRSEGGGLGVGGSPSGLLSARGAADFLTRSTTILAILFVVLSIFLVFLASVKHALVEIDTSPSRTTPPATASELAPATGDPTAPADTP